MSSRRQALAAFGAASAAAIPFGSMSTQRTYNPFVPTDPVSVSILRNRGHGLPRIIKANSDPTALVSQGFMSALETNLARISDSRIRQVLFGCGPAHVSDLLSAYRRAEQRTGRNGRLVDLFAARLPVQDLVRISGQFAPDRLWQSISQHAPTKLSAFGSALETARAAGSTELRSREVRNVDSRSASSGVTIEMTVHEIYLSFRTAPIGSLGVLGATYQTLAYSSAYLGTAWYTGYQIGTGINWLIDRYAPDFGNWIGGRIFNFIDWIQAPFMVQDPVGTGRAQEAVAWEFALGGVHQILESTGGDYQVVSAWSALSGGSCGIDPNGCPIYL